VISSELTQIVIEISGASPLCEREDIFHRKDFITYGKNGIENTCFDSNNNNNNNNNNQCMKREMSHCCGIKQYTQREKYRKWARYNN
jgi:hypothetical protein